MLRTFYLGGGLISIRQLGLRYLLSVACLEG